jgi:hypothetical protein
VFVARHAIATALVVVALAVVAGVFLFARPQYVPEHQTKNIDVSRGPLHTVQQVRAAFARQAIHLDHGGPLPDGADGGWFVALSTIPAPVDVTHLQVYVFGPKAKGGWGETHARLEALFGNVAVTYDGTSDDVLRRAKAAVAELR